ncbi:MAG: IclR family transcriptional regulator [Burkholderiales bacterium]
MPAAPPHANQSVARALRILRALAAAPDSLGVRDLARSTGVSPSIAQRLLATLSEFGFAEQDASRRYRVGLQAYSVGNAFLSGHALAREGLAELRELADRHQLNSYLGVLRGRSIVYLLALQSSGPIAIKSAPGSETHLHTTALGKAMLAHMDEAGVSRLLGPQPYARLTPHTKTRLAPLMADLRAAARSGYAVSDEENLVGVYAVGAALRDASGAAVAAISGALPRHMATRARQASLCRLVRDAADRISARLGGLPQATPRNGSTHRRA